MEVIRGAHPGEDTAKVIKLCYECQPHSLPPTFRPSLLLPLSNLHPIPEIRPKIIESSDHRRHRRDTEEVHSGRPFDVKGVGGPGGDDGL